VTVALFWDIDGTLLTTARAGVFSLEDALEQVTGVRADLQGMATAGMTDYAIAEAALREAGVDADEATVQEYLRVHGEQLAAYLGRRKGRVLPNVREILDDLRGRDGVRSYLLTGNIEAGARAKLSHYGLLEFFGAGGAFCIGPGDREEIALRALPLANDAEVVWVIGDTPADVACGHAIGARTLAVATGSFDPDALRAAGATAVVEQLPPPERFADLVGAAAGRQ
jgi:phosphoglycolate phosphatase-like HAD superfamily hydrolase